MFAFVLHAQLSYQSAVLSFLKRHCPGWEAELQMISDWIPLFYTLIPLYYGISSYS
jgi:hypothetical protein